MNNPQEIDLLHKIAATASDYVLAKLDPDFATKNGGVDQCYDRMVAQVARYQTWLSVTRDCRETPR